MLSHTRVLNRHYNHKRQVIKIFLITHLEDGSYFYWNREKTHIGTITIFRSKDVTKDHASTLIDEIFPKFSFFNNDRLNVGDGTRTIALKPPTINPERDWLIGNTEVEGRGLKPSERIIGGYSE